MVEDDDPSAPLYAVAPTDFVRERTAIVKALRAAGRRDEAARVEKLPRPSPSVWAVNQLARREPALIGRLVALTARLQGQDAPVTRADYAETVARHRDVLRDLRVKAEELLQAANIRAAPEILARVVHDLRGVGEEEPRALIASGRLVRDLDEGAAAAPFASAAVALLPDDAREDASDHAGDEPPRAAAPAAPSAAEAARARAAREARARERERLRRALADAERAAAEETRAWETAREAVAAAAARAAAAEARAAAARAAVTAAAAALEATERVEE